MALVAIPYCTEAEITRFFGADGVLNNADNDGDDAADAEVVNDCINQATMEINLYAQQRYAPADLATDTLINRWATVIATRFLCQRRGNTVPASIESEWERVELKLERIAAGLLQLPGLALRSDMRPSMTNLEIDRRHRNNKIRRTPTNSTDQTTVMDQDNIIQYPSVRE
jgi:phage gp36-like protein